MLGEPSDGPEEKKRGEVGVRNRKDGKQDEALRMKGGGTKAQLPESRMGGEGGQGDLDEGVEGQGVRGRRLARR